MSAREHMLQKEKAKSMIVVVLIGPPGSGKGTQARLVAGTFGLVHLSTGEMLREAVEKGMDDGLAAKTALEAGELVSDETVFSILRGRLGERDCEKGVVLDGFPRSKIQAETLEKFLTESGFKVDAVISLVVDKATVVARILGRYTCAVCGEGYHDELKQPIKEHVCDECGSMEMTRRSDDNAETLANRIEAYDKQTAPLISYYQSSGILHDVYATGAIHEIGSTVNSIIAKVTPLNQ